MDMTRRKLLVSLGMAGAAVAASTVVGGRIGYAGAAGSAEECVAGSSCVMMVTIAELRAEAAPAGELYAVTDQGREGLFRYDPADTASGDNEGLVLVSVSGKRYKRVCDDVINAHWFGAKGDGIQDDTSAIQLAIDAGPGTVLLPRGTYRVTAPISLRGRNVILAGEGIDVTVIEASAVMAAVIDADETSDVRVSPFEIHHLTVNGGQAAAAGVKIRYRHLVKLCSVRIWNAGDGLHAKDTWLTSCDNCLFEHCVNGVYLVGSNHRSQFSACSFQGNTGYQLRIDQLGTGGDGNDALVFANCDFEFSGTGGGGIYFDGGTASFQTCYIGEGIDKEIFRMKGGLVSVDGGIFFYGKTADSFGFWLDGGTITVAGAKIAPQTYFGFQTLTKYNGGKVSFSRVSGATPVGGDQVMAGDPLDYGPAYPVFAERLGKSYTANSSNATITNTVAANGRKVTCTAPLGVNPVISLYSPLVSTAWRDGEEVYLVVNYASNKTVKVGLFGETMGAAPARLLGYMPNSSGLNQTYVKFDSTFNAGGYTVLEFYVDSAQAGDYIQINEVFLADSRMVAKGRGNFGNLYKC
ncbi:glycosyl hydrolase family 28-related protein [Paenibacillus sp. GCM10027626]|uniref:glycosyl hydrolase family 28-related protein n=1 Tax=Paenibacillus sp. GCM10027626 TaxID=3273411 RepID=UPI00363D988B